MDLSIDPMPEGDDVLLEAGMASPMGGKNQRSLSLSEKWATNKSLALEYLKRQREVVAWIESVLKSKLPTNALHEALKSGVVLRELMEVLFPEASQCFSPISRRYSLRMAPWKERENISVFLKQCKALGMNDLSLFCTDDLYEGTNMVQVLFCIQHFMRFSSENSGHDFQPVSRHNSLQFSSQEVEMAMSNLEKAGMNSSALKELMSSGETDSSACEIEIRDGDVVEASVESPEVEPSQSAKPDDRGNGHEDEAILNQIEQLEVDLVHGDRNDANSTTRPDETNTEGSRAEPEGTTAGAGGVHTDHEGECDADSNGVPSEVALQDGADTEPDDGVLVVTAFQAVEDAQPEGDTTDADKVHADVTPNEGVVAALVVITCKNEVESAPETAVSTLDEHEVLSEVISDLIKTIEMNAAVDAFHAGEGVQSEADTTDANEDHADVEPKEGAAACRDATTYENGMESASGAAALTSDEQKVLNEVISELIETIEMTATLGTEAQQDASGPVESVEPAQSNELEAKPTSPAEPAPFVPGEAETATLATACEPDMPTDPIEVEPQSPVHPAAGDETNREQETVGTKKKKKSKAKRAQNSTPDEQLEAEVMSKCHCGRGCSIM